MWYGLTKDDRLVAVQKFGSKPTIFDFDLVSTNSEWKMKVVTADGSGGNYSICEVYFRDGTQGESLQILFTNNKIRIIADINKEIYVNPRLDYHTYRVTVTATTYLFYIDGIMRMTGTVNESDAGADLLQFGDSDSTAGKDSKVNWEYVKYELDSSLAPITDTCLGLIDDLALWARQISENEIDLIYNSGTGESIQKLSYMGKRELKDINIHPAQGYMVTGATNNPTTIDTDYATIPEMEIYYVKGSYPWMGFYTDAVDSDNAGAANVIITKLNLRTKDISSITGNWRQSFISAAGNFTPLTNFSLSKGDYGAMKATALWDVTSGDTITGDTFGRTMVILEKK